MEVKLNCTLCVTFLVGSATDVIQIGFSLQMLGSGAATYDAVLLDL